MTAVALILPGGGYREHAPHEADPVAIWFRELGFDAKVLRYPLTRHPGPLDAVRERVAALRASGATRVLLIGFSAGGHAAGLAALQSSGLSEQVDGVVLGYPVVSFVERPHIASEQALLGRGRPESTRREVSLEALVTPMSPPFFLFHSLDDEKVPATHSLELSRALAAVGVEHELHLYSGGGHGGGLDHNSGAWRAPCRDWLVRSRLMPTSETSS
ncbi:acetyl esterase/lipase [Microbacterium sp. ZKA21]|uniref:alpha/beta hydrolase n=1 Tax=Microbacterium sp. ZKA21 TaxID=3381694 RepID=UPI003D242D40